jgi:hypothetical protein
MKIKKKNTVIVLLVKGLSWRSDTRSDVSSHRTEDDNHIDDKDNQDQSNSLYVRAFD